MRSEAVVRSMGKSLLTLCVILLSALLPLGTVPAQAASEAANDFCLDAPPWGQLGWGVHPSRGPNVLWFSMHDLPARTSFGVFAEEGSARGATELARLTTDASGTASGSVRTSVPLPSGIRRLLLESAPDHVVATAVPCAQLAATSAPGAASAFCLQAPAQGRFGWTLRSTAGPGWLWLAMRGLPPRTGIGVFVDEGTVREAYELAFFRTDASGAANGSGRTFLPLPTHVYRLLLQSGPEKIVAVAAPCQVQPGALPATGAGGGADGGPWSRWLLSGALFVGIVLWRRR